MKENKVGTQNMGGDITGWSARLIPLASYDERDLSLWNRHCPIHQSNIKFRRIPKKK